MKKFYLDTILLILFMLVMSFHFIPKILHEVLGLAMAVAMIGHFVWNWHAFKNQKMRLSALIDIILIACLILIIFTGICISNYLFNGMIDMRFQRNITIHQLHVALPFLFMILSGFHLGLHWQSFRQRFKNLINLNIPSMLSKLAILALILVGVYGSFLNRIGDRLLMQHIFATPATELPFGAFIGLMIGIFTIYIAIGFAFNKYFR